MRYTHTLFFLFFCYYAAAQERITISGFVKEQGSQEQLPGANVYIPGTSVHTVTNNYGFYSLTVPVSDSVSISFSLVGYEKAERTISAQKTRS